MSTVGKGSLVSNFLLGDCRAGCLNVSYIHLLFPMHVLVPPPKAKKNLSDQALVLLYVSVPSYAFLTQFTCALALQPALRPELFEIGTPHLRHAVDNPRATADDSLYM